MHWRQIGHAIDRAGQVDLSEVPSSGGLFAATFASSRWRLLSRQHLVHAGDSAPSGNYLLSDGRPGGSVVGPGLVDRRRRDRPVAVLRRRRPRLVRRHPAERRAGLGWADGCVAPRAGPRVAAADRARACALARGPPRRGLGRGSAPVQGRRPVLPPRRRGRHRAKPRRERGPGGRHHGSVCGQPGQPSAHAPQTFASPSPRSSAPVTPTSCTCRTARGGAVLLAMRPYGGYHYNLGRETFLVPVVWEDGWPVFAPGEGQVTARVVRPFLDAHPWPAQPARDEFPPPGLDLRWNALRGPTSSFATVTRDVGRLCLSFQPHTFADRGTPRVPRSPPATSGRRRHGAHRR